MPVMPKPRTAPPPPIPTNRQLALNQERQDKRARAAMKLDLFQTEVTRRALSWKIGARLVGEAYKLADNNYRQVLEQKKASDALQIQIFFSVLTIATSGALGWMSVAAATEVKGATIKLEGAFEDARDATLQALSGEAFSANGPLVFPPSSDTTVSQDPQVFQSELENRVDALHMEILQAFGRIRQKYIDAPLAAWDGYDERREVVAHGQWMKQAEGFAGRDDLPSVEWMARELERGRWAKYILDNHSYRDFGLFQTKDTPDDVGSDVRERLLELNVWAAQTVWEGHGNPGPTQNLWKWAANFKPRPFTEEKKHPGQGTIDHR